MNKKVGHNICADSKAEFWGLKFKSILAGLVLAPSTNSGVPVLSQPLHYFVDSPIEPLCFSILLRTTRHTISTHPPRQKSNVPRTNSLACLSWCTRCVVWKLPATTSTRPVPFVAFVTCTTVIPRRRLIVEVSIQRRRIRFVGPQFDFAFVVL